MSFVIDYVIINVNSVLARYPHVYTLSCGTMWILQGDSPLTPFGTTKKGAFSMPRKRAKQLKFFVSDKELERIKSKVAESKINQSDYLRKVALEKEIIVIDGIKELAIELKKIGVNINQLTKLAHQSRLSDHDGRLQEINQELKDAWHSLRQLIRIRDR